MGLLDNFLGGGDPNASLYGDALTPEQLAALRQRGLLGFLGGMQKSGALDSTIPTLTGRMPGSFASGLAAGAGGMGEAMDAGALNAMRAQQLGLNSQQIRANLALQNEAMKAYAALPMGNGGAQPSASPATALGDAGDASGSGWSWDRAAPLIMSFESEGGKNIPNYRYDSTHTAGGYFQITDTNWKNVAPRLGIDTGQYPNAMAAPFPVQNAVAKEMFSSRQATGGSGFEDWAPFNPRLAAAIKTAGVPQGNLASANPQGTLLGGPGSDTLARPPAIPLDDTPAAAADATRGGFTPAQLPGVIFPPGSRTDAQGNPLPGTPPPISMAPQGGLLQQPPPAPPQTSLLPPPAAAAAPPQPMGGGMMANPFGVNPQAAARIQFIDSLLGKTSPGFINETVGLQFAGPKALAQSLATTGSAGFDRSPTGAPMVSYKRPDGSIAKVEVAPGYKPPEVTKGINQFGQEIPGSTSFGPTGAAFTPFPVTGAGGSPQASAPASPGATGGGDGMLSPAQLAHQKALAESNVKRSEALYDGIQQQSTQFQRDMNPYLQLSKSILNSPEFYSGLGGQLSLDINKVRAAFGNQNAAMLQEALGKVTAQSVLSQINNQRAQMQESGGSANRIFSQQVELVEKAAPALATTTAGNRFLVNVADRMGNLSNTVAAMARDYKAEHGILDTGFDKQLSDYMTVNPVFSKQELSHPETLGAPTVPGTIQTPQQLLQWATAMGLKRGAPIRLDDGTVKAIP